MPAPAMKIPVQVDLESLKKQMDSGADHVGRAAKFMGDQFAKLNGAIAAGGTAAAATYATGFAGAALRVVGAIGLIYGAVKVLGSIIDSTREQLAKMVDIADKAKSQTVSPRFFQAFTAEAEKLQVKVSDLEGALTQAFSATKEKSPIDVGEWSVGEEKITDVEKALRVYNETLAKTAGQTLKGLVLFRDADNQEKKVIAVLEAMIQLESLGQKLAALDVGEKMFGAQFVDNIRQGRTSAAQMLETIKASSQASEGVFSNETIRRAKEIDDELKRAHQTLDKNLKPTWDSLAATMLTIKSLWASVVNLIAQAAALSNKVRFPSAGGSVLDQKLAELQKLEEDFAQTSKFSGTVVADRRNAALVQRIEKLKEEIKALQEDARDDAIADAVNRGASRGAGPAPEKKEDDDKDSLDALDRAILLAEKHTAVLDAETAAIDLGTAARQKAKVVAELTAAAIRANIDAGEENTAVSAEQAAKIEKVAAAFELVAKKAEAATLPLRTFAREGADLNRNLQTVGVDALRGFEDALIDIGSQAKSAQQAFKEMTAAILKDLARLIIRMQITGPIAQALAASFSFSGASAGPGPFVGPIQPSGSPLAPNSLASRSRMGGQNIMLSTTIDARGSNISEARLHQILHENNAKMRQQIIPIVREGRSRKVLA